MGDRGPSGAQGQVQGQPGGEPQREADGDGQVRARVGGTMGRQDRRPEAAAGDYICFLHCQCLSSTGPRGWQPHGPGWYGKRTTEARAPLAAGTTMFRRCPTLTTRRWGWHMGDFNRSRP